MEEDDTEWKKSLVESVPLSPAAAAGKVWRLSETSLFWLSGGDCYV